MATITREQAQHYHGQGLADPVWWTSTALGAKLWDKQAEIMRAVRDHQEVAVASCHGAGKSFNAACDVLWYLYNHRPSIVITTAPTNRQVKGILWKEIKGLHSRARIKLGGQPLSQELRIANDWLAWGFTAPDYDPERFQGFHEQNILIVVDEAAGVSEHIYQAIDGILTSEGARLLMISNPTHASGRFGQSFKMPGVAKISISAFDTPNFTAFDITRDDIRKGTWEDKITGDLPMPYLVTPSWVAKRYQRWGETSPLYQSRVEGKFPKQGTDTLIPLDWIERAQRATLEPGEPVELGVDVARYGIDETVSILRRGSVARITKVLPMSNTMETAGMVVVERREHGVQISKVDAEGLGAGVYDRLDEQDEPVVEMRSGMKAEDSEKFADARSEWLWGLRQRFEQGDIDIEDDDELAAQLANIKYKINSRGQIKVESKDEMRRRGLPSPDRADALMFAFAKASERGAPAKINIRRSRR